MTQCLRTLVAYVYTHTGKVLIHIKRQIKVCVYVCWGVSGWCVCWYIVLVYCVGVLCWCVCVCWGVCTCEVQKITLGG